MSIFRRSRVAKLNESYASLPACNGQDIATSRCKQKVPPSHLKVGRDNFKSWPEL